MSRHGEVRLVLGAEERTFRLGLGQMRAVEEKCDAGLPELAGRLAPMMQLAGANTDNRAQLLLTALMAGQFGRYRVDDYREVIYQGLIGGGESPSVAGAIVMATVDQSPPFESALIAFQIIMAVLLGAEDEPLGEKTGATSPAPSRSRGKRPAGPTSTAPAR